MKRAPGSAVEFRESGIAGRGVFAKRRIEPGQSVVAYAPKQQRVEVADPRAVAAAKTKLTLLSQERYVIIPDTTVPGGWLCNHSCMPNAVILSDGEGRIQCTRTIAPGEEVTIFYGWVTQNQPGRDPCHCGTQECQGFINFDITDDDARRVRIVEGRLAVLDDRLRQRLVNYASFLQSIGQDHVQSTIATTFALMRQRGIGARLRGA